MKVSSCSSYRLIYCVAIGAVEAENGVRTSRLIVDDGAMGAYPLIHRDLLKVNFSSHGRLLCSRSPIAGRV